MIITLVFGIEKIIMALFKISDFKCHLPSIKKQIGETI